MAVTRAKATALLNKTEMGLFDDSRSNAVRGHSEARLNQLVMRARTARDRAEGDDAGVAAGRRVVSAGHGGFDDEAGQGILDSADQHGGEGGGRNDGQESGAVQRGQGLAGF